MQFTVRQARVMAGLTQAEVAKRLGINRTTYIRLEKDPTRATVRQLGLIAQLTGIPVRDLFLGENSTFVER